MTLSEICIKRPVLATVLSLVLVVIGIMGFNYLDTRFLPKFEQDTISVATAYPGASAKLVETSITTPLEEAISGIQGIDTITSQSYQGLSEIMITLQSGFDVYQVSNKVRDKVEGARDNLPDSVDAPDVETGHGQHQLMTIGFVDKHMDLNSVRDYLERYVIDKIEEVPGISTVEVVGANKYAMRLRIDPQKMAARGLSVNQVEQAVKNSNVELPAGEIKSNSINFPITAKTKLSTVAGFNNIIIKNDNGNLVRIKDIGHATLGSDTNDQSIVLINGHPGVLLTVYNTNDANPLDAANNVNKLLSSIRQQLPVGMQAIVAYDQSNYMKASVHEVYQSIIFAVICVVIVIFLFLGHFRTVLIPIITIPICLLTTFGIMYFFSFSINIITLLALVLSIGLVVDDAIVILENTYRHIERGLKPFAAAIKGTREITFAVIAMTLTLAAVYAPVGLISGKAAAVFRPFAFTLAGAVIVSGFVALTLSPMMCARLLKAHQIKETGYGAFLDRFFERLSDGYQSVLDKILHKRYIVVIIAVLLVVAGALLHIPRNFLPTEDIGFVVGSVNTPSGSSINYIGDQTKQLAHIIEQHSAVKDAVTIASTNAQSFNVTFASLKPFGERNQSSQQIANEINTVIRKTPGLNAAAFAPSFGGSTQHQLEFSIMDSGSYQQLYGASRTVVNDLKKYPGLHDIQTTMKFDSQQYNLTINRNLAGKLNVSVQTIDNAMATFLSGSKVSTFNVEGKTYNVYVQALDRYLHNLKSIDKFYVQNSQGSLIPLSNLIKIQPILSQLVLPHYDRLRSATISAQLSPGYQIGDVINYLQARLPEILPANSHYAFTGMAKNIVDSSSSMGIIFILALIFIYLVLAAQFESFVDPFVILLVVPLSVIGALAALKTVHGSINLYTTIGLVTLIGLIAKHGILITTFANKLRSTETISAHDAVIKAAATRLRPILMTTAAMIFGALPLVVAVGASAASRRQIGMVLIGGLFFGTFFSLVLVPVAYTFAAWIKEKCRRRQPT